MHIGFLLRRFDRSWPDLPHRQNGFLGCHSGLDKQPCRHHSGPAETAATMDEDTTATLQGRVELTLMLAPPRLERLVRYRSVWNRKMQPPHAAVMTSSAPQPWTAATSSA